MAAKSRNESNEISYSVRMKAELRDSLKSAAETSGRSANAEINYRLENFDRIRIAKDNAEKNPEIQQVLQIIATLATKIPEDDGLFRDRLTNLIGTYFQPHIKNPEEIFKALEITEDVRNFIESDAQSISYRVHRLLGIIKGISTRFDVRSREDMQKFIARQIAQERTAIEGLGDAHKARLEIDLNIAEQTLASWTVSPDPKEATE